MSHVSSPVPSQWQLQGASLGRYENMWLSGHPHSLIVLYQMRPTRLCLPGTGKGRFAPLSTSAHMAKAWDFGHSHILLGLPVAEDGGEDVAMGMKPSRVCRWWWLALHPPSLHAWHHGEPPLPVVLDVLLHFTQPHRVVEGHVVRAGLHGGAPVDIYVGKMDQ